MKNNKNGLHVERLDNGMRLETNYKDGIKYGKETYWYENGHKASEGLYEDNKLEGMLTYWYENGHKASEGLYEDNKLEGTLTAWDDEGQIESEQEYKNATLNGKSIFYEKGIKTAEYILKNGDIVSKISGPFF